MVVSVAALSAGYYDILLLFNNIFATQPPPRVSPKCFGMIFLWGNWQGVLTSTLTRPY